MNVIKYDIYIIVTDYTCYYSLIELPNTLQPLLCSLHKIINISTGYIIKIVQYMFKIYIICRYEKDRCGKALYIYSMFNKACSIYVALTSERVACTDVNYDTCDVIKVCN